MPTLDEPRSPFGLTCHRVGEKLRADRVTYAQSPSSARFALLDSDIFQQVSQQIPPGNSATLSKFQRNIRQHNFDAALRLARKNPDQLGVIMTRHGAWAWEQANQAKQKSFKKEFSALGESWLSECAQQLQAPAKVYEPVESNPPLAAAQQSADDDGTLAPPPSTPKTFTALKRTLCKLAAPSRRAASEGARGSSVARGEIARLPPPLQCDAVEDDWQLITEIAAVSLQALALPEAATHPADR
jgi:hypothetical protein